MSQSEATEVSVKRKATARVENKFGELIIEFELRHRVDNSQHNEDDRVWNNIDNDSQTPDDLVIRYETNPGHHPKRDYWYAELELEGDERFRTVQDFIHDLHQDDENKIVTATATKKQLTITSSKGSSSTDWIKDSK